MQERLAFLNHHPQSHLALLNLTLFGESRQSRPYPPFGYLTNGLINLEKSKSQFAHSWFKCASTYPSQGPLGFLPSITCVLFLKTIRDFPLSKCALFDIAGRWSLPSRLRLLYVSTQNSVRFRYCTSPQLLLIFAEKKLCAKYRF